MDPIWAFQVRRREPEAMGVRLTGREPPFPLRAFIRAREKKDVGSGFHRDAVTVGATEALG